MNTPALQSIIAEMRKKGTKRFSAEGFDGESLMDRWDDHAMIEFADQLSALTAQPAEGEDK
jgi:phage gp16-like protein